MKQSIYNSFKNEKKLKHLDRKKKRSAKQQALMFWSNVKMANQED